MKFDLFLREFRPNLDPILDPMQIRQISIKIETLRVYGHIPPMVPEKGIKFVKFKKN